MLVFEDSLMALSGALDRYLDTDAVMMRGMEDYFESGLSLVGLSPPRPTGSVRAETRSCPCLPRVCAWTWPTWEARVKHA